MSETTDTTGETRTYWSDIYRGRHIATLQHATVWLAYLDKVLQTNLRFATAADANAWLRRRIDTSQPST